MNQPAVIATAPARLVRGRRGAVASPHHLATAAGLGVLRAGGSAVDAAIAMNAALGVVAGAQCGLGGDAFWLIWDPDERRLRALNGSGRAGAAASIESVKADGHEEVPDHGRWTVTIPGAIDSWAQTHARHGRLDWASLMEPAIGLAAGFPADEAWIGLVERGAARFGMEGDWARVYRPHGRAWQAGEIVRSSALGTTLRAIAEDGGRVAYDGSLAARTAAFFADQGVPIDGADLAAHRSDWDEPIGLDYRGVTSMAHPPNSVGAISLLTLGLLARSAPTPGATFDGLGWDDPAWIHLGLEASRIGLAERDRLITDPLSMADGALGELLSDDHLDELASRIDIERTSAPPLSTLPRGGGTVYITAADQWGGVVSLLASNFRAFGSGLVDPRTGICFQDRGGFFRLDPEHPNALGPRKRSTHTLTPGMLLRDGRPWIAHGSMGGEIQPQIFAQFVSAVVDGGADISTAVAAPRWAAISPDSFEPPSITRLEARAPELIRAALTARGHALEIVNGWSSAMGHGHAIEIIGPADGEEDGSFAATADPRSEGSAAAF